MKLDDNGGRPKFDVPTLLSGGGPTKPGERLADVAKRLKSVMGASSCGPLIASLDIAKIAKNWGDAYKLESGGLNCTQRTKKLLGKPLHYFMQRADAVAKLERGSEVTIDHHVAVWLVNKVPPNRLAECRSALMQARLRNNNNPPSLEQAKPIVYAIIGRPKAKAKMCGRCELLEAELRKRGLSIPN